MRSAYVINGDTRRFLCGFGGHSPSARGGPGPRGAGGHDEAGRNGRLRRNWGARVAPEEALDGAATSPLLGRDRSFCPPSHSSSPLNIGQVPPLRGAERHPHGGSAREEIRATANPGSRNSATCLNSGGNSPLKDTSLRAWNPHTSWLLLPRLGARSMHRRRQAIAPTYHVSRIMHCSS